MSTETIRLHIIRQELDIILNKTRKQSSEKEYLILLEIYTNLQQVLNDEKQILTHYQLIQDTIHAYTILHIKAHLHINTQQEYKILQQIQEQYYLNLNLPPIDPETQKVITNINKVLLKNYNKTQKHK